MFVFAKNPFTFRCRRVVSRSNSVQNGPRRVGPYIYFSNMLISPNRRRYRPGRYAEQCVFVTTGSAARNIRFSNQAPIWGSPLLIWWVPSATEGNVKWPGAPEVAERMPVRYRTRFLTAVPVYRKHKCVACNSGLDWTGLEWNGMGRRFIPRCLRRCNNGTAGGRVRGEIFHFRVGGDRYDVTSRSLRKTTAHSSSSNCSSEEAVALEKTKVMICKRI